MREYDHSCLSRRTYRATSIVTLDIATNTDEMSHDK